MKQLKRKKGALISILFLSILFIMMFQNIKVSQAQNGSEPIETIDVFQNFQIDEFSENTATLENVSSIDIDLGSSRWNVSGIELNFTNIKQEYEIKSIEDALDGTDKFLSKNFISTEIGRAHV